MHRILFYCILCSIYLSNNDNQNLLNILYDETNWVLEEKLDNGSIVYSKKINNINLEGIKISKNVTINPELILSIIKDVSNYNQILKKSSNVTTTKIASDTNEIIAHQEIYIPIFTDLYYFFKIYESTNRVSWLLENPISYTSLNQQGYALSTGCGGWNYTTNDDGSYNINYRLIFSIEGYPSWAINYMNYYSLINVFTDVLFSAENH